MIKTFQNIILQIHKKEEEILSQSKRIIDEAYEMTAYLQDLLTSVKSLIIEKGFNREDEEIHFFRIIKPQILGKLIYYNKIYRIETTCPIDNGKLHYRHFSKQLNSLKKDYTEHICHSEFFKYYKSGRTDKDDIYFKRGNINYHDGLNSIVFEIDPEFSTFFDFKVARIISSDLLYTYLLTKINPDEEPDQIMHSLENSKDIFWTGSKNALIELVYALYASGTISHGNISIRKISLIFQVLFRISIGDLHHAFHRMKTRSGSRTAFLDQLKIALEEYMDKEL